MKYNPEKNKKRNRTRKRKIIWFNPPFNKNLLTDLGKKFLKLIDKHFPRGSRLHKIFNRNTIKLSYSCTKNIGRIIKSHNKKLSPNTEPAQLDCNCRVKENCPLDGNCRATNIIYKCIVSFPNKPDKVYIGLTEGQFKKRYANHKTSFSNKKYSKTTLSAYIWDIKEKENLTPKLTWSILKKVPSYNNISKKCPLCLQEKLEIILYKKPEELLNKKSELISKCRHMNKFVLANFDSKD